MWNYVVRNGFVVDGTGSPWYRADVAISDGRIAEMSTRLPTSNADVTIDAKGLVVAPGFIDMHSHSELPFIAYPTADSMIRQGVTTELTCNCGTSASGPLKGAALEDVKADAKNYGIDVDWTTLSGYVDRFRHQGCSINGAFQVGHGTVRLCVMGWANRIPTKVELDEMKALVAQTMEEGAFGLSTGLMYTPGNYAETEEIIELAEVAAKYGGIHTSHDRRLGWSQEPRGGRDFIVPTIDSEFLAIKETIRIGEEAGIPTTWSHAKACGEVNWRKSLAWWFKEIEFARLRGVDVRFDVYPWTFRGGLVRGFPTWAEEGGPEKMRERLRNSETRRKIRDLVKEGMESIEAEHTWETALILKASDEDKDLIGKRMSEAAKIRGMEPVDLYIDRLAAGKPLEGISEAMHEEDVKALLQHPLAMVSTDGYAIPADPTKRSHPRSFGTFPKILRKYVREERILSLEEAIRRMTSAGAARLGLMDRGLLRPGFWADVTIFDPLNVKELATYSDPMRYSEGIEYVFVNGKLTIEHDKHTGARAGVPLKHRPTED